jgi:hypothetical protein
MKNFYTVEGLEKDLDWAITCVKPSELRDATIKKIEIEIDRLKQQELTFKNKFTFSC